MRSARASYAVVSVLAAFMLAGCGLSVPTDPDGTLDRVRSDGVLRVGASPSPGWVDVTGERPSGREPELVERFAGDLGVEVEWTVGGEEHLVRLLEDGAIDLAVGGVTDENPWVDKVGLTRHYVEVSAAGATEEGATERHVMMVPMGENAFQSELERWLDENGPDS